MAKLVSLIGYATERTKGKAIGLTEILTLGGAQFLIEEKIIESRHKIDTGAKGAERFFFKPDAEVWIISTASDAFAARPQAGGMTFPKYYDDDGGTPLKSYDDGYGPPKDPFSDKSPWDDKGPWDDNQNSRGRR